MTTINKYVSARNSSNLRSGENHTGADILIASAICGGNAPLIIQAKYNNDAPSVRKLIRIWSEYLLSLSIRDKWPDGVYPTRVAEESIMYWVNDICYECMGKRFKKMEFVDVLSGEPCEACNGSGRRKQDCEKKIAWYVNDSISRLESILRDWMHSVKEKIKE